MLKKYKIISETFGYIPEILYFCSVQMFRTVQIYKKISHIMLISNKNLIKWVLVST